MNVVKKPSIILFMAICILTIMTTAAFAATKIVYNGRASSGWTGSGSFRLSNACGYDGSMYWQYGVGSNYQNESVGLWDFGIAASNVGYYVYIPSCYSNAEVVYHCYYSWDRVDISVDQANYYNEWVWLGQFNTTDQADILMGNAYVPTSEQVGWDEVKYVY
ncbi:MAG: hypothetical protein ACPLQP_04340 [Moorellaceae bacterium]